VGLESVRLRDEVPHLWHVKRFRDHVYGAQLERSRRDFLCTKRRHHDDRRLWLQDADLLEQKQVVRVWQTIVEDDGVKRLAVRYLNECRRAIAGFSHIVTDIREQLGQRPPNQGLVVDDKHTWR